MDSDMKSITLKKIIEDAFQAGLAHMLCSNKYFKQTKPDLREYTDKKMIELKKTKVTV